MFALSKGWLMVAAFGQGVLFSLALTGLVRLACVMVGLRLSDNLAGNIFFISSLVTGSLSVFLYSLSLRLANKAST